MHRLARGTLAALALLILAVAPAAAGNWASITPDAASTAAEPVAGEPVELGFRVLQHGKTPASWVTATVVLVNTSTGQRVTTQATATGAAGHFVATVTPPDAGRWTWSVELAELGTDPAAIPLDVEAAVAPVSEQAGVVADPGPGVMPQLALGGLAVVAALVAAIAMLRRERPASVSRTTAEQAMPGRASTG